MKIVDFTDLLEQEDLRFLLSPKNRKVRSLVSTFFRRKIPLEPTSGKSKVRAIVVKPKTRHSSQIVVGLLWNALYGRKFKVYHWYILFIVLLRTMEKDKCSEAILSVLMILSTQVGAIKWQSNMKPLRSLLLRHYDDRTTREILMKLRKDFPYQLPRTGPKIDDLMDVSVGWIFQRKPKELARIGVGYKDQGSLSKRGFTPELPNLEDFLSDYEDTFEILVRRIKRNYPPLFKEKRE